MIASNNIDESESQCAEWKEANLKGVKLYDYLYDFLWKVIRG